MTNKIVLRDVEEFMSDYTPTYQAMYPLLLTAKNQQYTAEAGKLDFRRAQTIGDIRAKHLLPKDTEMHQVNSNEFVKVYKRYFLANQYITSSLQDQQGVETVLAEVLDEHQKQMDELVLYGEGTSNSTMTNNGLFYSADPNHTTEAEVQIANSQTLADFHTKIMTNIIKADRLAGRKVIAFYGGGVVSLTKSIYADAARPFISVLEEVVARGGYSLAELPQEVYPVGGEMGWMIINLDQIKFHYTQVPALVAQGSNGEKMYNWHNFLMGSTMVDCLTKDAVIRQPATIQAP